MAEDKEATVAAESAKQKSPIILIAVLVLVGVILAGGVSFFVATKFMKMDSQSGEARYHDPGIFVRLGDRKEGTILVNVGGANTKRFLKAGIVLEMNPGKKDNILDGKILQPAETKILDVTMQILRSAKLEEFDANKQPELKKKLKDEINATLGEGSVYEVYITSFLLQ